MISKFIDSLQYTERCNIRYEYDRINEPPFFPVTFISYFCEDNFSNTA